MSIADLRTRAQALRQLSSRPMRTETLALLASLFFTAACNSAFWSALTKHEPSTAGDAVHLVFFTGLLLTSLQWLLLLLVVNRWTAKPLLFLLCCLSAPAVYFMSNYGVYIDTAMARNVFETDAREAGELLSWSMLPYWLGYAVLPGLVLWRIRFVRDGLRRAIVVRAASLLAGVALAAIAAWVVMDELAPVVRERVGLRFLVTPSNLVVAGTRAAFDQAAGTAGGPLERRVIAADARRAVPAAGRRPQAVVLVVGETVRAADWGLNAKARNTTPQLATRGLVNFPRVVSCGTDTATSLPCMFSARGRAHYDEDKIRHSESLLHVLARVGVGVLWRDNQSGCKGVCDGLPTEDLSRSTHPGLCDANRCFDGILLEGLRERIAAMPGDSLIVLHMLGNHGPAYYQRYPAEFRRFTPTCDTTELAECSREALVNTYDNGILYADHVLAKLVDELAGIASHDTAMLFVSDHGESLGEKHLYLHGVPYAIAPREQTRVPMAMWISPGFAESQRVDLACLSRAAQAEAVSHDNLFHTLLGMFDVQTKAYVASQDVMAACRG
jgi:lipid A ethanolaminephosphotransferase